jgi:hypothetical protein
VTHGTQADDPFPYPQGSVVGGFVDEATVDAARDRLEQVGYGSDRYDVLHGAGDVGRIDATGEAHGKIGTLIRKLQGGTTDEGDYAHRYAEYLRDGHYLIGVRVGDDEAAKQRVAEALRGAEFLTYYAASYIEELGANG